MCQNEQELITARAKVFTNTAYNQHNHHHHLTAPNLNNLSSLCRGRVRWKYPHSCSSAVQRCNMMSIHYIPMVHIYIYTKRIILITWRAYHGNRNRLAHRKTLPVGDSCGAGLPVFFFGVHDRDTKDTTNETAAMDHGTRLVVVVVHF